MFKEREKTLIIINTTFKFLKFRINQGSTVPFQWMRKSKRRLKLNLTSQWTSIAGIVQFSTSRVPKLHQFPQEDQEPRSSLRAATTTELSSATLQLAVSLTTDGSVQFVWTSSRMPWKHHAAIIYSVRLASNKPRLVPSAIL